ncbi:MAG: DUF3795 domain-containing protein [Promethearchaeota archaeon]
MNNNINKNLIAPCGVFCGVCPYLIAYKTNDERLKEKLAKSIGIKPEDIICEGCLSDKPLFFCKICKIKSCVLNKGIESCALCNNWPCELIENYPYKPFIIREKWDVNYRKRYGEEKWIKKTIEMNSCPSCNTLCHWKARICKQCGNELKERYI